MSTAPILGEPQISTALISFAKDDDTGQSSSSPLGTVLVRLHSDLVPLGVGNLVSCISGYPGTPIRCMDDGVALECGDYGSKRGGNGRIETETRYEREPYWRLVKNQHHFPHDGRGLLSWVGGKNDSSAHPWGNNFLITLGEARELDEEHLVLGFIDLFDPESARALESIERSLQEKCSIIRISDFRLVGYEFKDLLDGPYSSENSINWEAVRSLMSLIHCHPEYGKNSWMVGKNNWRGCSGERNLLHAVLYHNAPADIISKAISFEAFLGGRCRRPQSL